MGNPDLDSQGTLPVTLDEHIPQGPQKRQRVPVRGQIEQV